MRLSLKNNLEKAFLILIPLLFTFPFFKESLSTFIFILVAVTTFFYTVATKEYALKNKELLYFTIPFWIILIRSLFDLGSENNFSPVKNGLFFLLFPVVFGYIPKKFFTEQKLLLYLTILKNICAIIAVSYILMFLYYYDFNAFFVFKYNIPKFRDFVYNEVPFFKIHPTYFTAVVFLCTAFSLENILKKKKYWDIFYVLLFVGITFLLLVKINMLLLFLLTGGMLLFRSSLNLKQKGFLFISFLTTGVLLITFVPGVKNRFTEMADSFNKPPTGLAYDSTNIRVAIVECSLELAEKNYLWGVGFSNLSPALENCFSKNYDSNFYLENTYLTHNYYFYIFISSGILGALFLALFLFKLLKAVRRINIFLLTITIGNVLILNLSEDFFYRHYGLFFFCLILFSFFKLKENTNPSEQTVLTQNTIP